LQVYVLDLDHEQQRIALSLARTQPDPWENVEERHNLEDIVEGTIGNVVDFGAFVVLDDGIEGLLHVTEMGDGSLQEPHSYVQRGDRVTMRIVRIEPDRKRIGFTQKGLDIAMPTAGVNLADFEVATGDDILDEIDQPSGETDVPNSEMEYLAGEVDSPNEEFDDPAEELDQPVEEIDNPAEELAPEEPPPDDPSAE